MRVKNAFRILAGDANVIYKAVFFRLIISSILGIIGYFTLFNMLKPVFTAPETMALWDEFLHLLTNPLRAKPIDSSAIELAFENFLSMLNLNMSAIYSAIIGTVVIVFIFMVITRMGNFAIAFLYSNFMSSLTKDSLILTIFSNFGKAILYALIIVPIVLVYDVAILILSVLMIVYGVQYISVFAVILSFMFIVFAFSLKYTVFSYFLPNMTVENQSVGKAFVNTFKNRKSFFSLLGNYAFVVMLTFYLNVSVAVFTVGVGLCVSIPLTSIFSILISLVDFFNTKGRKYYVDSETVVVPKQIQENAELLKYM